MSKYTVQISGKGLSIEHSVNRALADQIALLLINERVSKVIPTTNHDQSQTTQEAEAELTKSVVIIPDPKFSDFVDAKGAISSSELVTCLGLFLNEQGQSYFTKNEYRAYFKMLKGKAPTNVPRDFGTALAKSWISEEIQEQFKVTSHGEKMCDEKRA